MSTITISRASLTPAFCRTVAVRVQTRVCKTSHYGSEYRIESGNGWSGWSPLSRATKGHHAAGVKLARALASRLARGEPLWGR